MSTGSTVGYCPTCYDRRGALESLKPSGMCPTCRSMTRRDDRLQVETDECWLAEHDGQTLVTRDDDEAHEWAWFFELDVRPVAFETVIDDE